MFGKLRTKLLLIFLFIGGVHIMVVGYAALVKSSEAMQSQAFAQLVSMREVKKTQIEAYIERAYDDIKILAGSEDTKQIQKLLQFYAVDEEIGDNDSFNTDTYEYGEIWSSQGSTLSDYVNVYGYSDVFIIQANSGHVVFSANRNSDLGANLKTGALKNSPLASLFRKVLASKETHVQDYQRYAPQNDAPTAFIGRPIVDLSGNTLAVAVLQLSVDEINRIMLQRTGMGESGETYLVGPDYLMRSDSHLAEESHSVLASFANPDKGSIKTVATRNALAGLSAYEVVSDYRDIPVLSAYTSIPFSDTSWALIAEIDESEAFGTIISLKWLLGFILVSGVMLITVIATVFTQSVTRPIIELTKNLETVAVNGDFSARVEVKSQDEIGQSADAFNSFMQSTQQALSEINKVMEGLAKGDFSNRIEADFQGDLLSIKEATNTSLENVENSENLRAEMEKNAKLRAEENVRVRQALDNVSTNTMIADKDYNIIYLNRTAHALMENAKDDFATLVPRFNPDKILGQNIDFFHKNPAHQRNILDQLEGTHHIELPVGTRTMAIAANAIIDDDGQRIGTVIEWTDRTEEVAIEREIDGMADAASRGDFTKQLSLQDKQGVFLNLAQGLNNLTLNTDTALADMQRILGSIASGNLTQRIEQSYTGRFGQLKIDTNSTIDKLTQVISNIRQASSTISSSSNEIASGNQDLSQRTEDQATSLQETAASMENMTETVKQSAENAKVANTLSEEARLKPVKAVMWSCAPSRRWIKSAARVIRFQTLLV